MRILAMSFDSGRDFISHHVKHYSPHEHGGALLWRTRAPLEDGERVLVEIRFPELPERMLLGGQAAPAVPPDSYWIRLSPDDRSTLDFLVQVAGGEVTRETARRHPRYPISLRVEWALAGQLDTRHASSTTDLSAAGAFVQTNRPPMTGTRLEVKLTTPGGETLHLPARVARTRARAAARFPFAAAALSEQDTGMGLIFDARSPDTARLREDLRRCEERGALE